MRVLIIGALVAAIACPVSAGPPRPTKSEYLLSTGAGFGIEKDRGAYYGMSYAVRKPLPGVIYIVATFDNPEDRTKPLSAETSVEAGAKEINLQSPDIHTLTNNKRYTAHLSLFLDAGHTNLLTQHDQDVEFSVPKSMIQQLLDEYGIAVK